MNSRISKTEKNFKEKEKKSYKMRFVILKIKLRDYKKINFEFKSKFINRSKKLRLIPTNKLSGLGRS